MEWWQAVVLAILQGITEFLPVSSSAHLILPSQILGWPDQGLAFDVAVHVGTLLAVMLYFRHDIRNLITGFIQTSFLRQPSQDGKMAWWIIFATLPAGLLGLCLNGFIEDHFRHAAVIASTTIFFGVFLWYADKRKNLIKTLSQMPLRHALYIGFAQALALVPGTSRSGITITMALFLGYKREEAARFSFLMSIPLILLAGGYKACELLASQNPISWGLILMGTVISCLSAYICIHFFLKLIEQLSMTPFVIYRLLLGVFLFAALYFSWIQ